MRDSCEIEVSHCFYDRASRPSSWGWSVYTSFICEQRYFLKTSHVIAFQLNNWNSNKTKHQIHYSNTPHQFNKYNPHEYTQPLNKESIHAIKKKTNALITSPTNNKVTWRYSLKLHFRTVWTVATLNRAPVAIFEGLNKMNDLNAVPEVTRWQVRIKGPPRITNRGDLTLGLNNVLLWSPLKNCYTNKRSQHVWEATTFSAEDRRLGVPFRIRCFLLSFSQARCCPTYRKCVEFRSRGQPLSSQLRHAALDNIVSKKRRSLTVASVWFFNEARQFSADMNG